MKNKGLSIIIPIYNFLVYELVHSLVIQAKALDIPFEVRVYDDCSLKSFQAKNSQISNLKNVVYRQLDQNLGRSKIRNKLAEDARYENLLFIDGDSKIVSRDYLKKYVIKAFSNEVIIGGTSYLEKPVNPEFALRWKYGKNREQMSAFERNNQPYVNFTINNLFIKRDLFLSIKLDESISTYGHEDTKFGYVLKEKKIPLLHIDNSVEHIGLEPNETFLNKTKESVKNLYSLSFQNIGVDSKLYSYFSFLNKYSLCSSFNWAYSIMKSRIEKNLKSTNPTLLYFDLYKLNLLLDEHKNRLQLK